MTNYRVRNLSLAIVDDDVDKQLAAPFKLVDLLTFPPCAGSRLSTLEGHCRNAATEKRLSFDLCSIDMNFQADIYDPVRPVPRTEGAGVADPAGMTASGLYHGMALLARREAADDQGNLLPLAWEVRSATPHQFGGRADLRADAIRGYALLRSLLASPELGETLEECLRREHQAANPHATPLLDGSLMQLFEDDLQKQDPSSGLVQEILKKLLPRWRLLFRSAVDDRRVHIHIPEMDRQLEVLDALQASSGGDLKVTPVSTVCVPIQGFEENEIAYGISLASIMSDLVANGRIDTLTKSEVLGGRENPQSVIDWCREVAGSAKSGRNLARMFENATLEFERAVTQQGPERVGELWRGYRGTQGDNKRFFLYILMRARLYFTRTATDGRNPGDKRKTSTEETLSDIYGINATDQTYYRPVKKNKVLPTVPADLRDALIQALEEKHGMLITSNVWDTWLAAGLRDYCLREKSQFGLQIEQRTLEKIAPGLFR